MANQLDRVRVLARKRDLLKSDLNEATEQLYRAIRDVKARHNIASETIGDAAGVSRQMVDKIIKW